MVITHMYMTVPSETFLRRQRPHGLMVIMRVSPPRTSSMSSQPSGSAFSPHSITSSYGNNTDLVCGVRALMRLPEESISRVSLDSRDTVHEASGNSPDLDRSSLSCPGSEQALAPRSAAHDHGHSLEISMRSSSHAICIYPFPISHLAICICIYVCIYIYIYI